MTVVHYAIALDEEDWVSACLEHDRGQDGISWYWMFVTCPRCLAIKPLEHVSDRSTFKVCTGK